MFSVQQAILTSITGRAPLSFLLQIGCLVKAVNNTGFMCCCWTRWSKKIWRKISDSESKAPTQGVCICLPENEIFNNQLFLYFSSQQNNKKMQAERRISHTLLVGRGFFLYKSTHIFFLGNTTVTPCDPCDWVVAPRRVIARYGNVGARRRSSRLLRQISLNFGFSTIQFFPPRCRNTYCLWVKYCRHHWRRKKGVLDWEQRTLRRSITAVWTAPGRESE